MIIESHEEYEAMLAALEFVMEYGPGSFAPIALLASAIEAYELIHFPIAEPTPEEAAAFRKAEGGPICAKKGHIPIEKMSAVICGRCGDVLAER